MSEEEEKIIKQVKTMLENATPFDIPPSRYNALETMVNLIEKQQKEIEELEQDNIELRKYYATRKEVEDLKDTINCLHESSKEYINKDKIRDKIKELDETKQYWTEEVIDILKSIIGE